MFLQVFVLAFLAIATGSPYTSSRAFDPNDYAAMYYSGTYGGYGTYEGTGGSGIYGGYGTYKGSGGYGTYGGYGSYRGNGGYGTYTRY